MRVSQWDLVLANLNPVPGSEQGGTRPVVIVSPNSINWSLTIATILPLTTPKPGRKRYWTEIALPAGIAGLRQDSLVMAHHIRTISQSRLVERWGSIGDAETQSSILRLLGDYFKSD